MFDLGPRLTQEAVRRLDDTTVAKEMKLEIEDKLDDIVWAITQHSNELPVGFMVEDTNSAFNGVVSCAIILRYACSTEMALCQSQLPTSVFIFQNV